MRVIPVIVAAALVVAARFQATGIAALAGTRLGASPPAVETPPPEARLAEAKVPSADAIVDRNPFDHETGPLRRAPLSDSEPDVPSCADVRPLVIAYGDDPDASIVSLDIGGHRVMRRRGGEAFGMRVRFIGVDRVWIDRDGSLCQASAFDTKRPVARANPSTAESSTSKLSGRVTRLSASEFAVDRGALDEIIESPTELARARLVPALEGGRVVGWTLRGIAPGSALALVGLSNGDRLEAIDGRDLSKPEAMLESLARLRAGASKARLKIVREGRPFEIDYVIR